MPTQPLPARRRSPPPPSTTHYDYLLKIILLGPSGSGKTSLLHHFLHSSPLLLSSQTIGVEFATKLVTLGAGATKKRIKLQLWDTAGTERFRSVSRSYYRGAAGAVLVYDVCDARSWRAAGEFLRDARVLGSKGLCVVAVGNKTDVAEAGVEVPRSAGSESGSWRSGGSWGGRSEGERDEEEDEEEDGGGSGGRGRSRVREVDADVARRWAGENKIPVCVETSAMNGEGVDEVFHRLARMILTKIETGEVNPDDPNSGIQYGDVGGWGIDASDGRSMKSGMTVDDAGSLVGYSGQRIRRQNKGFTLGGLGEWGEVFGGRSGRGGCC